MSQGDGGRSMFAPGDELPAGYERLKIEVFRERVSGPHAYNRLAVVAEAGDRQTMCTLRSCSLACDPERAGRPKQKTAKISVRQTTRSRSAVGAAGDTSGSFC